MEATLLGQAQPKPSTQEKPPPLPTASYLGPSLQTVNEASWDTQHAAVMRAYVFSPPFVSHSLRPHGL